MQQLPDGARASEVLKKGLGRRAFLRATAAVTALGGASAIASPASAASSTTTPTTSAGPSVTSASGGRRRGCDVPRGVLQPGRGRIDGKHYLGSEVDQVRWGYVPGKDAEPVLKMRSGQTVTVDTVSHEGILEDQGRDPVAFFGSHGVPRNQVLDDAIAIARDYDRTTRNFDVDGPHVVTGPIHVAGAQPGDVLKVETLSALPRVPYGVVSSRHGKGALPRVAGGGPAPGITLDEVMPPVATDGRASGIPTDYGNVSVFTPVRRGRRGVAQGVMPVGTSGEVAFPLTPFMGMMGVAFAEADGLVDPKLNSIPPTLGGGNIDIGLLGPDSAFYLPVFTEGALFFTGDSHMAMGDGEVALTAMEGSLRTTFRLTVCKAGSGDAPSVAYRYPFAETPDAWVPIGLSDPDGIQGEGQVNDLDIAMRRAVVNALDFLQVDKGMDRATAYAYLSAAADFTISQVVDRTVGVHGVIAKSHFG